MRRSIRSLALGTALLFTGGCFGSFPIVNKVYDFNKSFGSKILQQVNVWAFSIIPVYGVAGFLDVVIFNLIEFWTGGGAGELKAMNLEDGSTIEMQDLRDGDARAPPRRGPGALGDHAAAHVREHADGGA